MPTIHTTTYTSVFSGQNVGPAFPQYNSFTISANTELSWPAGFQNLNPVVAVNMDITATAGGFTVKMPDAEGAGTGYAFKVNNPGNFSFNLVDNANTLIVAIPSGTAKEIWLIDNGTTAGTWRTFPNPGGGSAVTSINATSSSNNLLVTGNPGLPITSAGTLQFALANDLLALSGFGASAGIAVRTEANTWVLRSISGTVGQIVITNPSGTAGNMTISLSNTLTNLVSVGVGNLLLSGNTIAATNSNGNITLNPEGITTSVVQLAKNTELLAGAGLKFWNIGGTFYTSFTSGNTTVNQNLFWPTTVPTNGQALIHSASGQLAWAAIPTTGGGTTVINSLARYSNTGGALTDSLVLLDNLGNLTAINSAQIKNVLIGTLGDATIATQITDQDLTISPNGLGLFISKTDFLVRRSVTTQSKLRLYNNADNFYAGLMANASMVANYTWILPLAGNTAGFFYTDNLNNMSITPMTSFLPAASTLNAVARYSNTTGSPLKDSIFVISDVGAATGLISSVIGNISISTVANTISSSAALSLSSANNTALTLTTTGSGALNLNSAATIGLTATTSASLATPTLTLSTATASSSTTTGALVLAGGLGVAGAIFSGALTAPSITFTSTSGIIGTTTNNSAAALSVGEFITATGSAVALTTTVAANICSISLTAGDWDVFGTVGVVPTSTLDVVIGGINSVSATMPATTSGSYTQLVITFSSAQSQILPVGCSRLSLSGTTTVYLVLRANFAGTCTGNGYIGARRRR